MTKYCNTCGFKDEQRSLCLVYNRQIDLDKDFCSLHQEEPTKCDICGNLMLKDGAIIDITEENNSLIYCGKCHQLMRTCQLCCNYEKCEFETNPSPIPKVVVKTIQQGNMTVQIEVKNEERIKLLCVECPCYDGALGCKKDFNASCEKIKFPWRNS